MASISPRSTMSPRRAGGGGNATASGISFQGYVGAWFAACHLLPDRPLHESLLGTSVQSITFETRLDVDDIHIVTENGWIFVQAKSTLNLSRSPDSELAKTVDQFVNQWVGCSTGRGGPDKSRPLQSNRDRFLIAVGPESSSRISTDLAQGLEAMRAGGSANMSHGKYEAVAALENQVTRAWCSLTHLPEDDAPIREILRLITIKRYDFAGPDRDAAEAFLAPCLELPRMARAAFSMIANHCIDLMAKRSGFDRGQLEITLAANGLRPTRAGSANENSLEQFVKQVASIQSSTVSYPVDIIDQRIEDELDLLLKSRPFAEFDSAKASLRLGRRLIDGNLRHGGDDTRAKALAWCARILSIADKHTAESYLRYAETIGSCHELDVAHGFLLAQDTDVNQALAALKEIKRPFSRSAALILVKNAKKARGAFSWMKAAGFTADDFDSDGKLLFLVVLHELNKFEEAKAVLDRVSDDDFRSTPLLDHWVAITHLLATVPEEYRPIVLARVPFSARDFPLASSDSAIASRRTARFHFERATTVAMELSCPKTARLDEEYAIWMDLRDPSRTMHGKRLLEGRLRDDDSTLHLVPLSVEFGIPLDHVDVDREIDREIAISGQTADAVIARFTMVVNHESPKKAVEYIVQHFGELCKHLHRNAIWTTKVKLLLRAGRAEEAGRSLKQMVAEGMPENQRSRIQGMIDEVQGSDPVDLRRRQYEVTAELDDLFALTAALEAKEHWNDLCAYARELFKETKSLKAAEQLALGLLNSYRSSELRVFLNAHSDLVGQSKQLGLVYSWALYQEGEIVQARAQLSKSGADTNDADYRSLWMALGIALGDWRMLAEVVADQFENRADRSGSELIAVAELAVHLGFPQGRELVLAAVDKTKEDPEVLLRAASLAIECDWEDVHPGTWLERAATMSGDEGPVWQLDIPQLIERRKEWDRRALEIWRLVNKGDAPMSVAAEAVGKSLGDVMLVPALTNSEEGDPRRRAMVPAYSGARPEVSRPMPSSIALDATALLTLGFVDELEGVLDAFDHVMIPHATMAGLFAEERKVAFRQSRRIRHAQTICDLIASDDIGVCACVETPSETLVTRIGEDLATLISEARAHRGNEVEQHIVVRSAPVYEIGPVMSAEADLREHVGLLRNCLAVFEKLRDLGFLTITEYQKAEAHLGNRERAWSEEVGVENGAVLYLDYVSVDHFLELGLLRHLVSAGFKVFVSQYTAKEAAGFLRYQTISDQAKTILERIRHSLAKRIESGGIGVGPLRKDSRGDSDSAWEHPAVGVISLASSCDAIAVDDRFVNRNMYISGENGETPIVTSLDIVDMLAVKGEIGGRRRNEIRTRLRSAGYCLVPVTGEELEAHVAGTSVVEGLVRETAELRAIRENLLSCRMRNWVRLPDEEIWLRTTRESVFGAIVGTWNGKGSVVEARARANWVLGLVDMRGWSGCFEEDKQEFVAKYGIGVDVMMLLAPQGNETDSWVSAYWKWLEERLLGPIRDSKPWLYSWIVDNYRAFIDKVVGVAPADRGGPDGDG